MLPFAADLTDGAAIEAIARKVDEHGGLAGLSFVTGVDWLVDGAATLQVMGGR